MVNCSQLNNSYRSLGKDMKGIFNELTKHLKVQKAEAEALRQQLTTAATLAVESDERLSLKLETCLQEERQQAALDRESLVSQITTLIHSNGTAQEQRFSTKVNGIRDEMATARLDLQTAERKYSTSMDHWSNKEDDLVEEVLKSRESFKKKLQNDWESVEKHSTAIEATTKSVHGETVRIVEAQMRDMAIQMQALDDFVTRARNHNDRHQASHSKVFERLSSRVHDTYSSNKRHLEDCKDSLNAFNTNITAQNSILAALPLTLNSSIQQPLSDLRDDIASISLTEYSITGTTPQKITYSYPKSLPRTKPHDELLGKASSRDTALLDVPDLLEEASPLSPSKANVYNDHQHAITGTKTRPATADSNLGLREVSINVGPPSPIRRSDPLGTSANSRSAALLADRESKTEDLSKSLSLASSLMGPPPLKRVATDTNGIEGSKLPKGTKWAKNRAEGLENVAPTNFSSSLGNGRRLRSGARGS